jgi:hypothetical protein
MRGHAHLTLLLSINNGRLLDSVNINNGKEEGGTYDDACLYLKILSYCL